MTKLEGLHTLVRTYCINAIAFWKKEYAEKRTGSDFPEYTYSDSDYNLFPRYNAIDAILKGVELIVPAEYRDFKTLKKDILEAGLENETPFTNNPDNEIEKKAIKDEKAKFKAYVEGLKELDIKKIEPLPLRRRLKTDEKLTVRQMLHEVWGYDGDYWEPLGKKSPRETVFLLSKYITEGDRHFIKELLAKKRGKHLYEVNETGDDYETDLDSVSSFYRDHEVMYFDETFKWTIYGSHEETITFGGEWLINSIKERFKDRPELLNSWN
jgi:hypothetical protein